jgi:geranylgeranyl diphosphate synthase type II
MRYSLANGGKRIRPALTLAFCRLCGGNSQQALPFALALECIHSYSLIHDDLPCMDNDDFRRGQLSCHRKFGEATAMLAGDALLTHAFALVAEAKELPPSLRCEAVARLSRLAGPTGMVGGQTLELAYERRTINRRQLEEMNQKKTGALLQAACLLGCLAAGASSREIDAAETYGQAIGLLFQLVDDILDVAGDSATLGKPVGSDETRGKSTWVTLLGLKRAQAFAQTLAAQARDALAPFGDHAAYLLQLTYFLAARKK